MKNSRLLLLPLLLLLGGALVSAQEPGRRPDKVIPLDWSPSAVSSAMGFEVVLRPGSEDKVEIYATMPENIRYEIDNGKRSIHISHKALWDKRESDSHLLAVVSIRDFNSLSHLRAETGSVLRLDEHLTTLRLPAMELKCFTGAELYFTGQVVRMSVSVGTGAEVYLSGQHTALSMRCSTGGEIEYDGTFDTGEIESGTGSDITLSGRGKTIHIDATSGSDIDGEELTVDSATLVTDRSSEITIRATDPSRITRRGKGDMTILTDRR